MSVLVLNHPPCHVARESHGARAADVCQGVAGRAQVVPPMEQQRRASGSNNRVLAALVIKSANAFASSSEVPGTRRQEVELNSK